MMIYIVETTLVSPQGEIRTFQRDEDRIIAFTWEEAEQELQQRGLSNTHKIIGQLVSEIPCNSITFEPDWNHITDYEVIQSN